MSDGHCSVACVVADTAISGSHLFKAIQHWWDSRERERERDYNVQFKLCYGNAADSITAYIIHGAPSSYVFFVCIICQVEWTDSIDWLMIDWSVFPGGSVWSFCATVNTKASLSINPAAGLERTILVTQELEDKN